MCLRFFYKFGTLAVKQKQFLDDAKHDINGGFLK